MEEMNYSKHHINRVERVIKKILNSPESWENYYDLYQEYEVKSKRTQCREMMAAIGAIMRFDLHGEYPNGKCSGLTAKTSYTQLTTEFKQLIDYYIDSERKRGKLKESTILRNSSSASSFMLSLQNHGVSSLANITEEIVLSLFVSEEGIPLRSYTVAYCIREVLKICMPISPDACKKLLPFIPTIKRVRKNFPYLTPQESLKIVQTLKDESNGLTLRNKAIGILAYYTGLRWCDIALLQLDSIDWEHDIIKIKQQKTNVPLEIPLTATVGNAVYEYLVNERPKSQVNALFFTNDWHPREMRKSSRSGVSVKIWGEAKIRQNSDERKGFHIFRHHFATTLLKNGVPQPIISSALGQLDPKSVETYLSADIDNLRKCALSIAQFPNAIAEVFNNG